MCFRDALSFDKIARAMSMALAMLRTVSDGARLDARQRGEQREAAVSRVPSVKGSKRAGEGC